MRRKLIRVGTAVAFTGLLLSFALAWKLEDPTPFTVVGLAAVTGKWCENVAERWGSVSRDVTDNGP